MSDDKTKVGKPDRDRVAIDEDYEVAHLAKKHGVTAEQVRAAIQKAGPMRDRVEQELLRAKGTR